MIRKGLTLLSMCCIIMCVFVGVLSHQEEDKAARLAAAKAVNVSCDEILDQERPEVISRMRMQKHVRGKFIADIDYEQDGIWEELCVPFFPKRRFEVKSGYRAVLVVMNGVDSQEKLDAVLQESELDVLYWPERQEIPLAIHSKLAQQYENLDLDNCPLVFYGVEPGNPLLGAASLQMSKLVGGIAAVVFFLSLISLFIKFEKPQVEENTAVLPTRNRAGLPSSRPPSGPSIFGGA